MKGRKGIKQQTPHLDYTELKSDDKYNVCNVIINISG